MTVSSWRSRRPLSCACLVVLCLFPACSLRPSPARQPLGRGLNGSDAIAAQVQELMAQRAEHLRAKDLAGYLSSVEPGAGAFESALAQGSFSVPLTGQSLVVQRSSIRGGFPLTDVRVKLQFGYHGLPPDNRFNVDLNYGLDRRGRNLRITSSVFQYGEPTPLWASGPVQTLRSDHFLALYRPGLPNPEQALALAEVARARLQARLGLPLEDAHLVFLAKDEVQYRQATSVRRSDSAALAQASIVVSPKSISVGGRQIVVNVQRLHSEGMGLDTLQHELAHLALLKETRPFTPAWVAEGAAMYLSGRRPDRIWKGGAEAFANMRFEDMTAGAGLGEHDATGSFRYAYAAAAAWYLIENFGSNRFWKLYRSFAEVGPGKLYDRMPSIHEATTTAPALQELSTQITERALQDLFGFGQDELDTRVRAWITYQATQ